MNEIAALNDELDAWRARAKEAEALNNKLRALINKAEWYECEGEEHCVWCGNNRCYGHADDCPRLTGGPR